MKTHDRATAHQLRKKLSLPENISDEEILSSTRGTLSHALAELHVAASELVRSMRPEIITLTTSHEPASRWMRLSDVYGVAGLALAYGVLLGYALGQA
jgi:hypothetical protein